MKKQKIIITVFTLGLLALLFWKGEAFVSGVGRGLSYCSGIIIPSLFPFMVVSTLAACGDLPDFIKKFVKKPMSRLFSLSPEALTVFLLSSVGGYPVGAKTADSLVESGKLSASQAKRLLLFCVNSGAGFAVNAVGNAMLNSREAGRILFASGFLASLILAFFSKFISFNEKTVGTLSTPAPSFSKAFVTSVTSSSYGMLTICGFVCMFSGISEIILSLNFSDYVKALSLSVLEVTNGCSFDSERFSLPILSAVISFGGLCIHMQIFSICKSFKPDIKLFYLFRIFHSAMSALICGLILHFFPLTDEVFLTLSDNVRPWSDSALSAISLLFLSALLILDLDTEKKIC